MIPHVPSSPSTQRSVPDQFPITLYQMMNLMTFDALIRTCGMDAEDSTSPQSR